MPFGFLRTPVGGPDGLTAGTAAASCLAIKTDYPASANGLYWLDPDGAAGNAAFEVPCDMTTNGGGWTLLATSQGPKHAWNTTFWSGTLGSNTAFNFTGLGPTYAYDTARQEKIFATLPFDKMFFTTYSGENITFPTSSTFAAKRAALQTPSSSTRTWNWNQSFTGGYTVTGGLFVSHVATFYTDRSYFGIATRETKRPLTSCGPPEGPYDENGTQVGVAMHCGSGYPSGDVWVQ